MRPPVKGSTQGRAAPLALGRLEHARSKFCLYLLSSPAGLYRPISLISFRDVHLHTEFFFFRAFPWRKAFPDGLTSGLCFSYNLARYEMTAQNRNSGLDQESDLKYFRKLSDTKIHVAESGSALTSAPGRWTSTKRPNSGSTACSKKNTSSLLRASQKCQTHSKRQFPSL